MILCLGLAPALQRTMIFKSLEVNEVNRAVSVVISAAGKSVNTARALASLGGRCRVAGFNGGVNGDMINRLLDEYDVDSALTRMSAETRICTTLIDEGGGSVTELVEEAPLPSDDEIQAFVDTNVKLIESCEMLVISGTLPPYAGSDFYCHFTSAAAEAGVPVVIDSHKSALLSVLADKPVMAKLNLRELEATFDCTVKTDEQIQLLLNRIIDSGAASVLMTRGREPAWLVTASQTLKIRPPEIERHVSPIGSGDCTTAGIAYKLSLGSSLEESARFGLACGSANVETLIPADFRVERVLELV
jgi:tagatose 6-phosphate kinase